MSKVRISVNRDFMQQLKKDTNGVGFMQLTQEAFSLLRWAVDEAKKGRTIVTMDSNAENPVVLELPSVIAAFKEIEPSYAPVAPPSAR